MATKPKQSQDDFTRGQLPPIPQKLRWLDQLSDELPPDVKRRLYLPTLAYSAAVDFHNNDPIPDNLKPYGGKSGLIQAFDIECFASLQSVNDVVEVLVGITAKDRIAYLNAWQSWAERLKTTFKEALDAVSKKEWHKNLERYMPDKDPLFEKDYERWAQGLSKVLSQPQFRPTVYLQKFNTFTGEAVTLYRRQTTFQTITVQAFARLKTATLKRTRRPSDVRERQVKYWLKRQKKIPGLLPDIIAKLINSEDNGKYTLMTRQNVEGTKEFQKYKKRENNSEKK